MKNFFFVLLLTLVPSVCSAQIREAKTPAENVALKKLWIVSELQALNVRANGLEGPLARATAKTEIADAAWDLDEDWAKLLLAEAYEFTFPLEKEQSEARYSPVGTAPAFPATIDRERRTVRQRVLRIAVRDGVFAEHLVKQAAERLGKLAEHNEYAALAGQAFDDGNNDAATEYILKAIDADPTQITAESVILDIAVKNRALADQLTLQYLERLRVFPLATGNQSTMRVHLALHQLIYNLDFQRRQIAPPGPAVMKAYVAYMIESLGLLEQREPGSLLRSRALLLSIWQPLRQYAPELTSAFLTLERLSQAPGEEASLPTNGRSAEVAQKTYEKRLAESLDSDRPDAMMIQSAISRGDFEKARKLIEKLPDSRLKTDFQETANMREAISFTTSGNLFEAGRLAERLRKAVSVLLVYPLIIQKCAAAKDKMCATTSAYQAMKQLKTADTTLSASPAGIPLSAVSSNKEIDPVLLSLGKLAKAVRPVNETLALEILNETVKAANQSEIETNMGRTGFEMDIFKMLAPLNEQPLRQAAGELKDPLRQIVALAAINQWKAEELGTKAKH
jgi:hypothetical protein